MCLKTSEQEMYLLAGLMFFKQVSPHAAALWNLWWGADVSLGLLLLCSAAGGFISPEVQNLRLPWPHLSCASAGDSMQGPLESRWCNMAQGSHLGAGFSWFTPAAIYAPRDFAVCYALVQKHCLGARTSSLLLTKWLMDYGGEGKKKRQKLWETKYRYDKKCSDG